MPRVTGTQLPATGPFRVACPVCAARPGEPCAPRGMGQSVHHAGERAARTSGRAARDERGGR